MVIPFSFQYEDVMIMNMNNFKLYSLICESLNFKYQILKWLIASFVIYKFDVPSNLLIEELWICLFICVICKYGKLLITRIVVNTWLCVICKYGKLWIIRIVVNTWFFSNSFFFGSKIQYLCIDLRKFLLQKKLKIGMRLKILNLDYGFKKYNQS